MLQDIINSVTGFVGAMKKDSCYESLDFLKRSIQDDLLPVFKDILSNKDDKFIKTNSLIQDINKIAEIKANNNYSTLEKINNTFEMFLTNADNIEQLIDKHVETNITLKTMSIKTGAIIKVLQDLMSMTSYTLDLVYFMLLNSDKSKKTDLPKIKLQQITNGITTYCEMYRIYSNNFKNTIKALGEVSEEKISDLIEANKNNENNSEWILNTVISKTGAMPKLPNSQGFIGNPIYHFRMWLIDRDIKRYESLKTKKQLIELKLMELRLKQNDKNDPSLTKQIEYYEEKLAKIEYEIAKIEK